MGISRIDSWTPFSLLHWLTHSPFGGFIPFISGFLILNIHWKDWCWSWSSNTLATWWEEPTHWKRPWCWLRARGEGGDKGQDGWMATPTQWTWVWANSGRWWRTEKPGVLQSTGSQRVRHDWATEQQQQKATKGHFYIKTPFRDHSR